MITAKLRTALGKQTGKLRKAGSLPAVLYGPKTKAVALEVPAKEFGKVYKSAGENTLVNLVIEGQPAQKKVLIHDVAKHYMKNEPIHVDFYEVDLSKKIHAKIPVQFVGTSPAVKELGGILIKNLTEVEVEALPADLPHSIEINIEKLATFDDSIRLGDIKLSGDVKILGNPEELVAAVQPPRSEEEIAGLDQPTAEAEKAAIEAVGAEPAKEGEGAGEGEKPAEGEKKAPEAGAKEEKPKAEKKEEKK